MNTKTGANWRAFADRFSLSDEQLSAFELYAHQLQVWNKKINLTAIDNLESIITAHFQDSVEITRFVDFNKIDMISDIGTGAGFPGLPLKIMFPHLKVVLIEVNQKKVQFLRTIVDTLDLVDVEVVDLDWRTFLRQTALPIELFLARASLQPIELMRIFKPQSAYKKAALIYWASQHWQPDDAVKPYINRHEWYEVDGKRRQYIFFAEAH